MMNSLDRIGNPNPRLKIKSHKIHEFGKTTVSKFMEPLKDLSATKIGKKPCARDGHSCCILNDNKMIIFGGDRHNMSFNDIFSLDLSKSLDDII